MQLCNDTITLYNRRFDPEEDCDVYGRTVIRGVHWFNSDATTVDSTGLKAANKVTIRIPMSTLRTLVSRHDWRRPAAPFSSWPMGWQQTRA